MRKLMFLLFAVSLIYSCGKETIETDQNTVANQEGVLKNSTEHDYVNLAIRAHIYNAVKKEVPEISKSEFGTADYSAILTSKIVVNEKKGSALSLIPIVDKASKETAAIVFFQIQSDRGSYKILSKRTLEKAEPFTIEIDGRRYDNKDVLTSFDQFDNFLKCNDGDEGCHNLITGFFIGKYFWDIVNNDNPTALDLSLPWENDDTIVSVPPNRLNDKPNLLPVTQSLENMILILQMDCSEDADPDGAGLGGPLEGQVPPVVVNATSLLIHQRWCKYKENCLLGDFEMVSPLSVPMTTFAEVVSNPYYKWAQYWLENPGNFPPIGHQDGCITTDEI